MRVLVTGAHGQLGREICLRYEDKGCTVFSCGSQELDITRYQDVSFCVKDFQPDLIVNCAAYNAVDDAEIEWEQAFCVNGFGPKNLALAAIQVGADIVHFSTDYVFNGKQRRPYTIADRPDPISRYGESKLLGEQMILNHVHRFYLIRTSWVFGSGNENFVDKVLDWSDKKSSITVVDDQVSSPTYTKDLAQATDNLVSSGQYGLYHITNSDYCSRFTWAKYILDRIGWEGTLIAGKSSDFYTPATRPDYSVLDNFGSRLALEYDLPTWQNSTERYLYEIGRI